MISKPLLSHQNTPYRSSGFRILLSNVSGQWKDNIDNTPSQYMSSVSLYTLNNVLWFPDHYWATWTLPTSHQVCGYCIPMYPVNGKTTFHCSICLVHMSGGSISTMDNAIWSPDHYWATRTLTSSCPPSKYFFPMYPVIGQTIFHYHRLHPYYLFLSIWIRLNWTHTHA
jgi:hypothetical protein